MKYRLGLKPPRPESVRLRLADYLDHRAVLPRVPGNYGHAALIDDWGMLGNGPVPDQSQTPVGDCAIAGPEHIEMAWRAAAGATVPPFTYQSTIGMYSAITGYDPSQTDPVTGENPTDGGADMTDVARYWQNPGFTDASNGLHRIGAFVALEPGNAVQMSVALYLFEAVGVGLNLPASAEPQFEAGQPWSVTDADIVGGHYVPIVGRRNGLYQLVTWSRCALMTPSFYEMYGAMSLVYLSVDMLNTGGKSAEGFDLAQLRADLAALNAV